MIKTNPQPELEVYLRASTPRPARERQREVIDRVERLAEEGKIADASIRRWDDRIVISDDDPKYIDAQALEVFDAFQSRAREIGHTLEPFFQNHERTGEREVIFPVICIAVRVDGELRRVFPCMDREGPNSVWDCLIALEADDETVAELVE